MDTKPVRNSAALGQKDQDEQEKAASVLLDSAINLRKQVTK
jgi:hypothetical protein